MSEDYLSHNWAARVEMETRWETDVVPSASTDAESRRQILNSPQRFLEYSLQPTDSDETTRAFMSLARFATQDTITPIFQDITIVTASSSGTILNCDGSNRRFAPNFDLVILPADGGDFGDAIRMTVASVGAGIINLTAALPSTVPAGSIVFPVMTTHQLVGSALTFATDNVAEQRARVLEKVSGGSIPASHPATIPAGTPTYLGFPIYTIEVDWIDTPEVTFTRTGEFVGFGRDQTTEVSPAKGRWTMTILHTFCDRDEFNTLLQFFDSRRGRLLPLWAYSPMPFFQFLDIQTTHVDVVENFDLADFSASIRHIAIVENDGTVTIREVQSIASFPGGIARITPDTNFPVISNADVYYVGMAMLCRFLEDVLRESWLNNEVCQTTTRFIELNEEVLHEIDDIEYVPGTETSTC